MTRVDHLVVTAGRFIAGKLADTDPDQLFAAMHERIAGPAYAIDPARRRRRPAGVTPARFARTGCLSRLRANPCRVPTRAAGGNPDTRACMCR